MGSMLKALGRNLAVTLIQYTAIIESHFRCTKYSNSHMLYISMRTQIIKIYGNRVVVSRLTPGTP